MASTSINIQPCKIGSSEQHNKREKPLDYVRSDLSHKNEIWQSDDRILSQHLEAVRNLVKDKTGRKLQDKATPIREGVIVIQQSTTIDDLQRFARACEERWGIKALQIHTHKDEGYMHAKEWTPNLHAHIVFLWVDETTGKSIKLNKLQMIEMQTLLADTLGMERGVSSDKKHLSSIQYKNEAERKRLEETQNKLQEATKKLGDVENIRERIETAVKAQISPIEELIDANTTKGWLRGSKTDFKAVIEQIKKQEQAKAIVKGAEDAIKDAKIERLEQELQRTNKALESTKYELKSVVQQNIRIREEQQYQDSLLDDDIVRLVYKSPLKQIEGLEDFTQDIASYHQLEEFKPLRALTGRIMPSQIFSLWFQRIEMRLGQFVASVSEQGKLLLDGLRPKQLLEKLGLAPKEKQSQDILKEEITRGGIRR